MKRNVKVIPCLDSKDGKVVLIPKIDDIVKDIDIDEKKIVIKPMKGLFE